MCRFPGFITILGVCVAVLAAIAIGVAPAIEDNAVAAEPVQVAARAERPALTLLSAQLFTNSPWESNVAVRNPMKQAIGSREVDEPVLTQRITQPLKRSVPEVAMVSDHEEHGPPYRR